MSFLRLAAAATAIGAIAAFAMNRERGIDDDDTLDLVPPGGSAAMIEDEALSGVAAPLADDQISGGAYGAPNSPIF